MADRPVPLAAFDGRALFAAMDERRRERGLGWQGLADAVWDVSHELNEAKPQSHPIAVSTIRRLERHGETTCQHALFFLRWLGRAPEDFLTGTVRDVGPTALPACGPDRRLRWDVRGMGGTLDDRRQAAGLTWAALAAQLGCQPSQVSGLRRARYGTGMGLAMRCVQWLGCPAATFVHPRGW